MATHSSVLAWRIPGTGESSGLPSMGSLRDGHDKRLSSSSIVNVKFNEHHLYHLLVIFLHVYVCFLNFSDYAVPLVRNISSTLKQSL